jgi:aspartyl protease family protein
MSETSTPSARRSTLAILGFWLALGLALWWFFDREQDRRDALREARIDGGAVVLKREADGHFWVRGSVNGVAVRFLVDTGASTVAVSDQVARDAGLRDGEPITVNTANGAQQVQLYREVAVSLVGSTGGALARVGGVSVSDGLRTPSPTKALLGQSFLRQFDVAIEGDTMTLRPRRS